MAMNIVTNKAGNKSVVVHVASANQTIVVAGSNTTSNLTATNSEVIISGYIRQVAWGIDTGSIQIKRAGNTVGVYTGSGNLNYASLAMPVNVNPTANLDITFGSANGYIMIEIQKIV